MKKGIELSVNFFVIIILSIVMFSFGIIFLSKILKGGVSQLEGLPKLEQVKLENCIKERQPLCLSKKEKEIKGGERDGFGIEITNKIGGPSDFRIFVAGSIYVDKENNDASFDWSAWTLSGFEKVQLENYEHYEDRIPISVPPGSPRGQYIFNVWVCYNDGDALNDDQKHPTEDICIEAGLPDRYDSTHKIIVTV